MSHPANNEHERLRDDVAAYALGALGDEERAALERHLESCEACRERLGWLQPAVDVLPASVEQRTPPESLRESLLTTVRGEANDAGQAHRARPRARRRWRWQGARALRPAVGFAVLLLLTAGVATGYLLRGTDDPEPTFIEAQTPSGLAGDVSATLERRAGSATLHVHELPKLDPDEVYEVWVERAGGVEPGPLFVPRSDGTAEAAVPGSLAGAESVLVTREPRGGSEQPTNPPLLEAPLQ